MRIARTLLIFYTLSLCAALVAGCKSSDKAKPAETTGDPTKETPAPTGTTGTSAEKAAPEDPQARAKRVEEALARVAKIQTEVAALRGLPMEKPVPAEHQDASAFRAFVKAELDRELPVAKRPGIDRAFHHLGLVPEPTDIAKVVEDAFVSQAGAYYDPRADKFFLVMVPTQEVILDTISAHELVHAVQDAHFDLIAYIGQSGDETKKLSDDAMQARRFVVEGEASMLMVAYLLKTMAKQDPFQDQFLDVIRQQLEAMATMNASQFADMTKQQSALFADMGEDVKKAIEAMDKIPKIILVPLMDAYFKGALTMLAVYKHGGWEAVTQLYKEPPQSTEQVMHPAEKLVPTRDYPVVFALPAFAPLTGWERLHEDVLGELSLGVYFDIWGVAGGKDAAAGWDGDRFAVFAKDKQTVAVMATAWDSDKDAKEFADAYMASLAKRFGAAESGADYQSVKRSDGTLALVRVHGSRVDIVDGAALEPGLTMLGALKSTKPTPHPETR